MMDGNHRRGRYHSLYWVSYTAFQPSGTSGGGGSDGAA